MKIMIMMKRMMIMKGGKRDSGRGGGGRKGIQRRPPVGGGLDFAREQVGHAREMLKSSKALHARQRELDQLEGAMASATEADMDRSRP